MGGAGGEGLVGREGRKGREGETHIKHSPLLLRRHPQRNIDQPPTLVVQNIRPNFANQLGRAIAVQVVVLDLEVLAQGQEDVERRLVRGGVRDAGLVHGEGDWEVEGVEGGFVDDDEVVLGEGELAEVDDVFGRGDEVDELAHFGLVRRLGRGRVRLAVRLACSSVLPPKHPARQGSRLIAGASHL